MKYTHSYILLKYFMRPAEISSHFMLIRRHHKTLNIVHQTRKKSHLNQEIKKLIKKIFSLSYTMSNAIKSLLIDR